MSKHFLRGEMRGPVDVNDTVIFVAAGGLAVLTGLVMAASRTVRGID